MNNTLHSFGCSFSEHFYHRLQNSYLDLSVFNSYKEIYGEDSLVSWHEYISNEFKLNLNIQGHSGGSNYQIFQSFCDSVYNIKENDIVIIEWTYINRFRVVSNEHNGWTPILSNQSEHDFIEKGSLNKILFLRETKDYYKDEIISYMKIINELCILKGCKIYYWTIDEKLFNYFYKKNIINEFWLFYDNHFENFNYVQYILDNNGLLIKDELSYQDPHFGIMGNKVLGNLICNYIKK